MEQEINQPVKPKVERLQEFLKRISPVIEEMEWLAGIIKKYQLILSSPSLLFRSKKDWIAFLIAFRLYSDYKASKLINADEVKSRIESMRKYDSKFAEDVNKILPFIGGNSEVSYLIMYRNDADNWRKYDDTYDINFFIERIKLFLEGGFGGGRFGNNMQFIGLHKDFGDKTLRNTILENKAIRNLLYYNEQVKYLGKLIDLCKKSEESGKWEGFWGKDGFWDKAGKGKGKNFDKYAEAFEKTYGNKHFAEELMTFKEEIEERPEGWGGVWVGNRLVKDGILTLLLKEIQYHPYQREKIIIPASLALSRILREREEKLKAEVISKFSSLLKNKKRLLLKELERETSDLITKISSPFSAYDRFSKEQMVVMAKSDLGYRENKIMGLHSVAESHAKQVAYLLQSGGILNNLRGMVRIDGADSSGKLASFQKTQIFKFEHLSDEYFQKMEWLLPEGIDVVKKLRLIVLGYIKPILNQKYIIRIENTARLQIEINRINQEILNARPKKTFDSSAARIIQKAI